MILRNSLLSLFFIFSFSCTFAKISLPSLFQDGMVLQQNSYVSIWGNASAGESIEVFGSWDTVGTSTFADTKGQWLVQIPTPAAGGPFNIKVSGENQILIRDVLIGEVWIASGQSNMEWPLNKSEGGKTAAASADFIQIRFFKVGRDVSSTPRIDCKGSWRKAKTGNVDTLSAVAFHFAKDLYEKLQVPIGIIQTAWGGTPAEAWTPRANLESQPDFQPMMRSFDEALSRYREFPNEYRDPIHAKSPGILYNAMLAPLIPYTIRGAIWYQGESNAYNAWQYRKLFPLMVDSWRKKWGYRFSFYFVQIAPFAYKIPYSGTGIREAQYLSRRIPRSGMVSTLDIGNPANIHPVKKKEVGERLSLHALAKDYGKESLVFEGPVLSGVERSMNELRLEFKNADQGLILKEGTPQFQVAGQDKVFYPADARIEGKYVYLTHAKVFIPVACRYAWEDTAAATLFNQEGLPASSFRTDDWPVFFSRLSIRPEFDASREQFKIEITYPGSEAHDIHYTINGAEPSLKSPLYEEPFYVSGSTEIKAKVGQSGVLGTETLDRRVFNNKALTAGISNQTSPNTRYKGRGARTLVNGIKATADFQDKEWLGYTNEEIELVLDLGEKQVFQKIGLSFLDHPAHNIYAPTKIEVYYSTNARKFKLLKEVNLANEFVDKEKLDKENIARIIDQELGLEGKKLRYLKVVARNRSTLLSAGSNSPKLWLFWDEINVE